MAGIDAVSRWAGGLASALVVVVALIGSLNALLRYASRYAGASLSSNAWLELQWYLFAMIFLLGAAMTLREDAHVRVDVLYGRCSRRKRDWIDLIGTALFLVPFCVLMIWSSWNPVLNSWSIREGSPDPGGLPRWPIKMLVPVAFVLLLAQGVANAARIVARLRRGDRPPDRGDS